jgi:hypothetical protein
VNRDTNDRTRIFGNKTIANSLRLLADSIFGASPRAVRDGGWIVELLRGTDVPVRALVRPDDELVTGLAALA